MGEEMAYWSRSKLHPSGRRIPSVEFVGLLLGLFLASGAGQLVTGWPAEGAVHNSGTSSDPAPVAASKPPVAIPQSVGWFEIPGTKLQSVCPPLRRTISATLASTSSPPGAAASPTKPGTG